MITTREGKTRIRPWEQYQGNVVEDGELSFIQQALLKDPTLSAWWGFRPRSKRRPIEAIRRVATDGNPDNQSENRYLARMRSEPASPGSEEPVSATIKQSGAGVEVSMSPRQLELPFA